MSKHYIYRMDILENDTYCGSYIGQHRIGEKSPSCDGYKGSGCKWKKDILKNHIPVQKTILRLCDSLEEANYWEQHYIEEAKKDGVVLWNVAKGGGGHDPYRVYTKEEIQEHNKARFNRWYESNKEHIVNYRKCYYKKNKERLYAYNRKRIENDMEAEREYQKQYYLNNKERIAECCKQYYERNKENISEQHRKYWEQYRVTHAEQLRDKNKQYYAENKDKQNQYYSRPCLYNGETITFRALTLRLRRRGIPNPSEIAKQYLIEKEK